MAENATAVPAFDNAVRDFITEQLQREPFCTVGVVEEHFSSLEKRLTPIEKSLVCGPLS